MPINILRTIDSLFYMDAFKSPSGQETRTEPRPVDQAVGSSLEHTHEGDLESMLVTNASSSGGETNPLLQ